MIIFSGCSSISLGKKVAHRTNAEIGKIETKKFPDGEIYIRILSDIKGKECAVIQSTKSNDDLVKLILLLDLLRDLKASKVYTVVPYLGYARQDKRFEEGEALSAKTIVKILDEFSDSLITVNCHFLKRGGECEFHGIKMGNLDAFPLLAGYFRDKLEEPMVIAPDKGSLEYAQNAAEIIGCDFDFLEKERISGEEVRIEEKDLHIKDKDILILDDMISTGATIIEAAKFLYTRGVKSVNVGCVHGVFSKGIEKVRSSVDNLICTDTIERGISKVTVSGLIADKLMSMI
ncbi:MAG: ribose-phosphate diphosphokinase [Candidatus Altiarchaeales archaeon]|nr:MAG: ribose-phosphate diphosphokinase [Candidatus Altiarchaeales archaeon]